MTLGRTPLDRRVLKRTGSGEGHPLCERRSELSADALAPSWSRPPSLPLRIRPLTTLHGSPKQEGEPRAPNHFGFPSISRVVAAVLSRTAATA
jgi:hypothetical protein